MSLFLLLVNYIAALVAVQLLRGDLGGDTAINFGELFNSFLAMYQVFSSENWVDVLYGAAEAEIDLGQTALCLIFISAWMLFANCEFSDFYHISAPFSALNEFSSSHRASNVHRRDQREL
jgi:hypothetical protein